MRVGRKPRGTVSVEAQAIIEAELDEECQIDASPRLPAFTA
jgi:hypothetical protein